MTLSDRHRDPGLSRDPRRDQLRPHAAGGIPRRWLPTHRLDFRRQRADDRDVFGRRIVARISRVKPIDIGQQHQHIGVHHLGHPRGEAVIVAKSDFGRRHRVVLVDHRDATQRQQRAQRRSGVEIAAPVFRVVQRQQQLRGGQAAGGQGLAPGLRQPDLADRCRRLFFLQPQLPSCQPQGPPCQCDGAGRDDDNLRSPRAQRADVLGDPRQPGGARRGGLLVHDQSAADLHDHSASSGERGDHAAAFCLASWMMFCKARNTSGTP